MSTRKRGMRQFEDAMNSVPRITEEERSLRRRAYSNENGKHKPGQTAERTCPGVFASFQYGYNVYVQWAKRYDRE